MEMSLVPVDPSLWLVLPRGSRSRF